MRRGEVRERAVRTRREPGGGKRREPLGARNTAFKVFHETRDTNHGLFCVLRPSGGEKCRLVPPPPRYAVRIIQTGNIGHVLPPDTLKPGPGSYAPLFTGALCPKASLGPSRPSFTSEAS